MAKVNIAISAEENFLALVNTANPDLNATAAKVTVGVPTVSSGTEGRNTSVVLSAVANAGFSSTQTFAYTRQALAAGSAIATAKAVPVTVASADTDAQVLTKVATALGLLQSELTIADIIMPENEDTDGTADVVANASSLLYTGTYSVTLSVVDVDVPLDEAAPVTDLNGFEPEA